MSPGSAGETADLDQMIAECSRLIARFPGDARAHRDRGLFYARKRSYDEALGDFDRAIFLNPNDAHAHGLRALIWESTGDNTRAVKDFDTVIELDHANS